MILGRQLPLGTPIPDSLHAVSVSIPTMADVVGYEEKKPETMARMPTGYPRFIVHTLLREIERHWQRLFAKPDQPIWLTSSEAMAKRLQERLAPAETKFLRHRGVCGVRLPADPDLNRAAKLFLQHVGGLLSTRQAEDYLVAEGLHSAAASETLFQGDAEAAVQAALSPILGSEPSRIVLTGSGMNAFFAAFDAINDLQAPRGRKVWLKLGWLYTDTMRILDELGPEGHESIEHLDIFDQEGLESIIASRGPELAAIVTEAPTNPLVQTIDLDLVYQMARSCGAFFVVDPTVNSPANLDVTGCCDVIVNSLTKYAASEGDVIMGCATVTATCPDSDALLAGIARNREPAYARDVARLATQIGNYQSCLDTINANTLKLVAFLESHPKIRRVYWALEPRSRENYLRYARSEKAVGGLISFEYDGPIAEFHDRYPLAKGPSFGMTTSLLCPFIYLAHYDLVTSAAGRERLATAGISPELLRFAVGAEPIEELIAAFEVALG